MEKPGIYTEGGVKIKGEALALFITKLCMQLRDFCRGNEMIMGIFYKKLENIL